MIRAIHLLTLSDMGEILGFTSQQVQKYEIGENPISLEKLTISSRKFDIPMNSFFD